jgi:D-glycero-D-manno-heptose 1,7-bisphosphate phosphatase
LTEAELGRIHDRLFAELARRSGAVDGVYYCPHHPSEGLAAYRLQCRCRKPDSGMIMKAAADLGLALSDSYVVGDQVVDMQLAERAGTRGIWIRDAAPVAEQMPPGVMRVVPDLWEAARWLTAAAETSDAQNR